MSIRLKYLYLFSDGYQNQFGGEDGRKFMSYRLKQLFLEIHQKPMMEQHELLDRVFNNWMGKRNETQIDDVLVIGLKVNL